jgi:hypothetical protein
MLKVARRTLNIMEWRCYEHSTELPHINMEAKTCESRRRGLSVFQPYNARTLLHAVMLYIVRSWAEWLPERRTYSQHLQLSVYYNFCLCCQDINLSARWPLDVRQEMSSPPMGYLVRIPLETSISVCVYFLFILFCLVSGLATCS